MRGYTIEMSVLVPMVLVIIMTSVLGVFYFHDKAVLNGAAYETASVGATLAHEKEGASVEKLEQLFEERAEGKCIFFSAPKATISVTKNSVTVEANAKRKWMAGQVCKTMPVLTPEDTIRDLKNIGGALSGT